MVRSTSTASVMFAESSRSSTTGGTGTTNTRIAPTIVTGRTTPERRDQPAATRLGVCGRHPFPSTTRTSTALPRHATTHDRPETDRSLRPQGRRASLLDQTRRRTSSPESVRLDSTRFRSTLGDELQTCGGTILPNPAGVQTESVVVGPWSLVPGSGGECPRRIGLFGNFRFVRSESRQRSTPRRIGLFGNFRFVRSESPQRSTPRRIRLFGNFRFVRLMRGSDRPPADSDSSHFRSSFITGRRVTPVVFNSCPLSRRCQTPVEDNPSILIADFEYRVVNSSSCIRGRARRRRHSAAARQPWFAPGAYESQTEFSKSWRATLRHPETVKMGLRW